MPSATLNLRVSPRRMLTEREAAEYCGRTIRTFKGECPVAPTVFGNGDRRFDMQDLDRWLDGLKLGTLDDADAILERLG
jgi:hypothetical protein